ncbi:transposase [Roseburia sp. 1XD42-69]|nr:transposase [Roseburia sp. 1XD42-69]
MIQNRRQNRLILTRKIQIIPLGEKEEIDRVYKYLRDGIFYQNKAMNQYMSALYIAAIKDISKEDRKELNRLYSRVSNSKKGSAYDKSIEFAKNMNLGYVVKQVKQDFANSCKNGLLCGKVSLPTYRKNNPLLVHVNFVRLRSTNYHQDNGMYHNYESHTDFLDHLYSKDLEVFIKFANNITFKMIFGNPHKSAYLRSEIQQIFEENYKVCGSSIQIDGKKIILNLSMDIPKQELELDENIVVGVDLGLAIPAMCGLNTNDYIRQSIGSKDDFLRIRTQLQSQRRRLQKSLASTSGGHGRQKKLKPLEKLKDRERNFVKTYNHYVSKNVVDFAVKNKAKYINVEDLSGFDSNQFILRNWSFYELQQFITYKAAKYGIEVRKINPYHTSQICSCCGHWEEGQRIDQAHFKCKSCGAELNADFNASRNIAMSTDFV